MMYEWVTDIQVDDVIIPRVGGTPAIVTDKPEFNVITLHDGSEITNGMVQLLGRKPAVTYFKNQNSGIAHAYIRSTPLCGAQHSQNATQVDGATCQRCKDILGK